MTHSIVYATQVQLPQSDSQSSHKRPPAISLFSVNRLAALMRIRFATFSIYIQQNFGLCHSLLFDEVLRRGWCSYKQAVEGALQACPWKSEEMIQELQRKRRSGGNLIEDAWITLISHRFIVRVSPIAPLTEEFVLVCCKFYFILFYFILFYFILIIYYYFLFSQSQ